MEYDWLLKIKLVKLGNSAGIKNLRKPKFRLSKKILILLRFIYPVHIKRIKLVQRNFPFSSIYPIITGIKAYHGYNKYSQKGVVLSLLAVFNWYSRPKFNIARYLIYKFYILANKITQ